MKKDNKICLCCGIRYTYCPSCSEFKSKPRWMTMFHNENCKELFDTTTSYNAGSISAEEARDRFDKCDLSYMETLKPAIIDAIDAVSAPAAIEDVSHIMVEEILQNDTVEEAPVFEEMPVEIEETVLLEDEIYE